jgi:hypothetical protein
MKQTVTARFNTWDEALHAQTALVMNGFAAGDIELPVQTPSVLAGIERLVASFFTSDLRRSTTVEPERAPGEPVVLGVHVDDAAHAALAEATLLQEHAVDVAVRDEGSGAWAWGPDASSGTREHSLIDELGLTGLADAMRRHAATPPAAVSPVSPTSPASPTSPITAAEREPLATPGAVAPGNEAEATVLTSASAPGAGAVMGHHVEHVETPSAPEAVQPAKDAAPQIPDEFLEYEDDTPVHRRTLH